MHKMLELRLMNNPLKINYLHLKCFYTNAGPYYHLDPTVNNTGKYIYNFSRLLFL